MFRIISVLGILAAVIAIIGHYLVFGPKHPEIAKEKRDVKRFSMWERFIHAVTLLSFAILAGTGFGAVLCKGTAMSTYVRMLHSACAPVFSAFFAFVVLRWSENARFSAVDWAWAKKAGGYLGYKGEVDAERFNGGQKAFFWVICCLTAIIIVSGLARAFPFFDPMIQTIAYEVHRYASLFIVITAIVHAYLGSLANPGTIWTVITGKVSKGWAKHHHSLWWEKISGKGD